MLSINMDDVYAALSLCAPYLIGLAVVVGLAVVALVAMAALKGLPRAAKFMARCQIGVAVLLALAIVCNLVAVGPMSTLLDLVSGRGTITEESAASANALCVEIAEEGIVLAQNNGNTLPLSADAHLNVFGWGAVDPCYGGTGSGSLSDNYPFVTLLDGLAHAGIQVNEKLVSFYTEYCAKRPAVSNIQKDWTLPEPNVKLYTDSLMSDAKSFSDTAMIVITRVGGEGADLPTDMPAVINGTWAASQNSAYDDSMNEGNDWDEGDTYLDLTNREEELIELVCQNFDRVIVVYNGANALELGWTRDYPQIKSVLLCPGTGQSGFDALGEILAGTVNPSGRTADTYVADLKATPTWNNFGSFIYDNAGEFEVEGMPGEFVVPTFINYVEGIYVGYKFYETAAAEGLIDYDKTVVYPFGYGLSYTTFTQEMGPISASNGVISFDVTVTNTGSAAGKDVVEVYYNPPYTNGGIEKSSANLVAFDKTGLLEPGASQTVTISFNEEDMASYDTYGAGAYVLEQGDYIISINSDAHRIIDSQTYTVSAAITYGENNSRSTDLTAAVNVFGSAEGDVTYLSRADGFANYAQATAAPSSYNMSDEAKSTFYNLSNYDPAVHDDPDAEAPVTGASGNVQLADLRGRAYDDPLWDDLLDQLTDDEMNDLISLGGFQTAAIKSIGKINTIDCDGPASINNNFTRLSSIGFPSAVLIACTWNEDIAKAFGESIGEMADEMGVSGWYAPAMNTHRSAFSGRNFEYYSEDGLLSGKMAANAVAGAEEYGVYAYIKHFALNDQETNRTVMLCTWSSEQAIREIYLKPFELAVKEGKAKAVMAAFNYIGNEWSCACSALLKSVLRDEWGFQGFVLTDNFGVDGYMSADWAVRNGTDCILTNFDRGYNNVSSRTPSALQAMRGAAHNILYTTVNSRAYASENLNPGMPAWQTAMIVIDVVVAAIAIGLELLSVKGYNKRKAAGTDTPAKG